MCICRFYNFTAHEVIVLEPLFLVFNVILFDHLTVCTGWPLYVRRCVSSGSLSVSVSVSGLPRQSAATACWHLPLGWACAGPLGNQGQAPWLWVKCTKRRRHSSFNALPVEERKIKSPKATESGQMSTRSFSSLLGKREAVLEKDLLLSSRLLGNGSKALFYFEMFVYFERDRERGRERIPSELIARALWDHDLSQSQESDA